MIDEHNNNKDERIEAYLALSEGATVGRYKIVRKLGSGGMGDVYLVEDIELRRPAALKFLSLMLISDVSCKTRFIREAQAAAKLNHPNIVTIYEVGDFRGRPFMAMEYIEGESLRDLIKKGSLETKRAIGILREVARGLAEAHAAGIVHRDIKPANILLDKRGHAKLFDFGLAVIEGAESLTKTGSTLGTVAYMSPEQVLRKDTDNRSDIFSLGIVFYEMLSGMLPFQGEIEAVMMYSIANEAPKPLRELKPEVPERLQRIIDRALVKSRENRYQTCAEIINDLEAFIEEIEAKSKETTSTASPNGRRSVAVMYFEDFAGDNEIKWLSKGLPHMLISNLEQSTRLKVVGYQRMFDILKSMGSANVTQISAETATEVCRSAQVNTMILGGIFKQKDKIRIDYSIQDVESGQILHAGKVIGKEPFAVADRLGAEIREKLITEAHEDTPTRKVAAVTHSKEAYRYYLEGLDYYFQLYWDDAVASFQRALRIDPNFAMAHYGLALLQIREQPAKAREAIGKAMENSGRLSQKEKLYVNSIHAFIFGEFAKAVENLQTIAKNYKDEKDAFYWLGFIYRTRLGRPEEAIKYFNRAIDLDTALKPAYNELAYAYDQVRNLEKAIWAADKYIELAPDEANPHDTKGDLYANNGRLLEAIGCYNKALEIKPDFPQATHNLGVMSIFARDYARAQNCFRHLSISGNKGRRAEGRTCLAWIPMYQGKFRQALAVLNDGLVADGIEGIEDTQNANKHLLKACLNAEMKCWGGAIGEVLTGTEKWHKAYPNDPAYGRHFLIQIYVESGDLSSAEKLAGELKDDIDKTNPAFSPLYFYAEASIMRARGDLPGAFASIEAAARAVPLFNVHFSYASICLEAGRLETAVTELEKMLSVYNTNRLAWAICAVKAYYLLAVAYERSGWKNKSLATYREFLEIWKEPDTAIAEVNNARLKLEELERQ